jgi:histidine kinase
MIVTSLRARLLVAFLVVVAVAIVTAGAAALTIGPQYFAEAMGHLPGDPMGDAMARATHEAFFDALRQSLVAAAIIAGVAATVVSLAVAAAIVRPVTRLAASARRVAGGHYAERVAADGPGELGELGESFNEMAASLEAIERRRVQLVGDVAHELRTPLTTLAGYLEGLEDGVIEPSPATWHLLNAETDRLTRLVSDLSELWRAEAQQMTLRRDRVDLATIAATVLDGFAPVAASRGVALERPVDPVPAVGDPDRIAQILANYVSNALRFAPTGSAVSVVTAAGDGVVRVGVRDHGPGLPPDKLEAVFERFYRVDPSRARPAGGAGIGLTIARALAEAMGGHAWAERPADGEGVIFYLELPAA